MNKIARTAAGLALLVLLAAAAPASAEVRTVVLKSKRISVGPYQAVRGSELVKTPELDGFIVEMDARVVDENDQVIPQHEVMLHHLVFMNGGTPTAPRRDPACPGSRVGERFFGTSEELRALTLPEGYGYPIAAMDRWRMGWMLMNHLNDDRKAYIRYTVKVDTTPGLTPVKPYWLSVVTCDEGRDPQYSVPGGGAPGSTHKRRKAWTVPADGRIVAVGGHQHGGARSVTLLQKRCANRAIFSSRPTYGMPDDPVYAVKPLLHEPDPLNMSWWQSATGVAVKAGERLGVTSAYDGQYPRMRVMGIMHVYIAQGPVPAEPACAPMPADAKELGADFQGRSDPPYNRLTLARMGRDGYARPTDAPPGAFRSLPRGGRVSVSPLGFSPPKIVLPVGAALRWNFGDRKQHDVTVADGPRGFGSMPGRKGDSYRRRFDTPGTYKLFCSLHPVTMSQVVKVRPR